MDLISATNSGARQATSIASSSRFISEHMSCLANQTRHRHAINSEVGAYVDDCHSRPQPVSKKIHLLFEPAFLFEQDVGRDGLQTFRNRERYGIRKLELDCVQPRFSR